VHNPPPLHRGRSGATPDAVTANWEGPYRVRAKTGNRAYYLENLYGEELPRPWNTEKLNQYYS
ncbi:hypothetical protein A2U01_0077106, partial [Trifolium medium]|nr:hypothetical protein [Trifolium medium]